MTIATTEDIAALRAELLKRLEDLETGHGLMAALLKKLVPEPTEPSASAP